jgi:hypothetical protein
MLIHEPSQRYKGSAEELRSNQTKTRHALPPERERAQTTRRQHIMRRRFKADPKWITVRHPARCAEPNCQTPINSGERGFYYPGDKSLYGSRCGHGEKAERDFAAHRIDEDSY